MSKLAELIAQDQEIIERRGGITLKKFKDHDGVGKIVAVKNGPRVTSGQLVVLGQKVFANGRYGAPNGTMGIVIGLNLPYEDDRTSDILVVWFEGFEHEHHMKFKDLEGLPIGFLT